MERYVKTTTLAVPRNETDVIIYDLKTTTYHVDDINK